ncbi:hypothetical protein ACIA5D_39515 [Actinoplanes sp. NPDC051513]|uniref:hypothetical protein n=1 Tax=Actinoplanes sp. NPDC051513 TaxID=3363908 RepID=UPI0037894800
MGELHPGVQAKQPGRDRRGRRGHVDAGHGRGRLEQTRIAERLGRRDQQKLLGVARKRGQPLDVALLDPAGHRMAVWKAVAAGKIVTCPGAGQLEQGERIAVTLGHDLIDDLGVDRTGHVGQQQGP